MTERQPEKTGRRERAVTVLIWTRYFLPPLTGVVLFVTGFFYNVWFYMGGEKFSMPLFRFYFNTLAAARDYLGGERVAARSGFYGVLSAGAGVGILCYLAGLFFTAFAAVAAVVCFRRVGNVRRVGMLFRVFFPNRVCLALSDCLFLVAALYPQYYAAVSARFLVIGGEATLYGVVSVPFFVTLALTLVTLALALFLAPHERRRRMNLFTISE